MEMSLLEPYRRLQEKINELEQENQILKEEVKVLKTLLYGWDKPRRKANERTAK
jgi:hypothetical protein